MNATNQTLFVPTPADHARRAWKSFPDPEAAGLRAAAGSALTRDKQRQHLGRLQDCEIASLSGDAPLIPAQVACIFNVNLTGTGIPLHSSFQRS